MPVAKLTLEVELHFAQSLKDRRQVVRSIKDTLRRGFNLSVAELDDVPLWNRATLGAVAIHTSRDYLLGQLDLAERAARRIAVRLGADILEADREFLDEAESTFPTPTIAEPFE